MKKNKIMEEVRSGITPEMEMQMELSVAIANRIYKILEEKGLSQKDFARMMGKTETEVSRWLSGTHNLTLATLCKISTALEADVIKVTDGELVSKKVSEENKPDEVQAYKKEQLPSQATVL